MTILWPVCNWKCIKYLQEAFKTSELIFTGTRPGLCIAHRGLCDPGTKNSSWGTFSLPKATLAGKTFISLRAPQKMRVTRLDLPHFRDKVFVLDLRSRFRQIGV